jgi:cell division protein FtsB
MNFIQKLQAENKAKAAQVETLRGGFDDLRAYMALPKFASGDRLDGYVNIGDVLLRLREIEQAAVAAGDAGVW